MSKISLQPNASGAGTFSIVAPDSNTNRTLTLPDESGAVLSDVSDIESQVKAATNASGSAPVFACRAWVNFDGTGTVAIRASGNVSSITDNGVGDYTVNFSTAMEDADYSVCGSATDESSANINASVFKPISFTASNVQVKTGVTNTTSVFEDYSKVSAAIFR